MSASSPALAPVVDAIRSGDADVAPNERALRSDRIVETVLQLAAEGGYDAVQLREVSRRSGVALRTIYKYYGSRENLAASAMTQWLARVVRAANAAISGDGFVERMSSCYRHIFDAFRSQPKLFDALACLQREIGPAFDWSMGADAGPPNAEFAGLDPEFVADFFLIVGSTLYSGLHFCVYGGCSFDSGWAQVERAIRRVTASHIA